MYLPNANFYMENTLDAKHEILGIDSNPLYYLMCASILNLIIIHITSSRTYKIKTKLFLSITYV